MNRSLSLPEVISHISHNGISKLMETEKTINITTDEYLIVNVKDDYDEYLKLNNINYPGDTDFIDLYVVYDLNKNYLVIPDMSMDYKIFNEVIANNTRLYVELLENISSLPLYEEFLEGMINDDFVIELINKETEKLFKATLKSINEYKFRIIVKDDKDNTIMSLLRDRVNKLPS